MPDTDPTLDGPLPAPLVQRIRWLLAKPILLFGWWIAG